MSDESSSNELSEIVGFDAEEMVECLACRRMNAPNRAKCLYCGQILPVPAGVDRPIKLGFRSLEAWEKGQNIVLIRSEQLTTEQSIDELSNILRLDSGVLKHLGEIGSPIPVARVETETEGDIIRKKLAEFSVESRIVPDEDLKVEKAPTRLRSLEFRDDHLFATAFNANDNIKALAGDIVLVVSGMVVSSIADSVENKKIRRPGKIESTETTIDEFLIDIYAHGDDLGWRIPGRGFDFSCLGDEKSLSSGENSKRLVERLRAVCPNARFVGEYDAVRGVLDICWPPDVDRSAAGINRKGFGGIEVARRVVYDRTKQFTKYSRMLRSIL